ncbi:elongator complex protein 5 [Nilaparvata lugens]|uniref:elongator complex protein 5 n=1 Tax=Nilaparvata lugens TaxID=108931 RepID=UPI00193DDA63|nr:elongator complex protein 5 [Nilaparvata lugens]
MFIKQLIDGDVKTKFVLIKDDFSSRSSLIISKLIEKYLQRSREIHVFCFESSPNYLRSLFSIKSHDRVHFHDVFSECGGWLGDETDLKTKTQFTSLKQSCMKVSSKESAAGSLIIIDSLSYFLMTEPLQRVSWNLQNLLTSCFFKDETTTLPIANPSLLVGLSFRGTLEDQGRKESWIESNADAVINVMQNTKDLFVKIEHKKGNGGLTVKFEKVWAGENGILRNEECAENASTSQKHSNESENLPDNLTTFKLDLREEEKLARSQLKLPFLKDEEEKQPQKQTGMIYYTADDNDDDEEDPDDDLEI